MPYVNVKITKEGATPEQKAELIRRMGLTHMAHHRAQLGVYLRLLGVPIPGTYGPSADEPPPRD